MFALKQFRMKWSYFLNLGVPDLHYGLNENINKNYNVSESNNY